MNENEIKEFIKNEISKGYELFDKKMRTEEIFILTRIDALREVLAIEINTNNSLYKTIDEIEKIKKKKIDIKKKEDIGGDFYI